ncbi:MFS transporter [Streptomyces sp. NPDC051985]|uniref:MFS transporter n=1 Tax=Streptomyces sp. NPDC051985 TaxID=3155807 RepID=UPI003437FE2E
MKTVEPAPSLVAEPSVPGTSMRYLGGSPLRRYLLFYGLAMVGINALWGAVVAVLLPLQVQNIEFAHWFTGADAGANLQHLTDLKAQIKAGTATATPVQEHQLRLLGKFEASRASSLSAVTAVGVFVTMLIQPVVGVLSDRTRSRWGRRAPWIAGGAVVGAALLIGQRYSTTIAALMFFWAVAQLTVNIAQAPLTVSIADRVPEHRLSTGSAVTGLASALGTAVGSVVVGGLFSVIGLNSFYLFALAVVVPCVLFVLMARDRSSLELPVAPLDWRRFLTSFFVPLRDADYRWVFISKLAIFFGYGVSSAFGLYMLQSYIRPALSTEEATRTAPLLVLAGLPCTVLAMIVAGWLSDRTGRRKPFVLGSSLLFAAAMLVPMIWPTLTALFVQAVIAAAALGCYVVVDQALFIDVLPDKQDAGRDLGMSALAGNFGQAVGPIVAGQVVALSGGYFMVWPTTVVIVLVAAVAIVPVRSAR